MFENEQISTRPEVDNMLRRLEARVDAGKYNESTAKKAVSQVVTGIVKAKEILNKKFDFNTKSKEEIAALTNAWVAWNKAGVFEGEMDSQLRASLQGLLSETEGDIPAGMKRFARQIWRTEMVGYIIEKVQASTRSDKGDVVEAAMTVQKVTDKEDDPIEALGIAQNLDDAIKSKSVRKSLAARMEATDKDKTGGMKKIAAELLPDSAPLSLRVVVGGELLTIPPDVSGSLTFKNIIKEGNRVYAQMLNGCRGNLAIIELGPPGDPSIPQWSGPGPATPGQPGQPGQLDQPGQSGQPGQQPGYDPNDPNGPNNPNNPNNPDGPGDTNRPTGEPSKLPYPVISTIPPGGLARVTYGPGDTPVVELDGHHVRETTRRGELTPSAEQFHELVDADVMSENLIRTYEAAGLTTFIEGLDTIPSEHREAVLGKVLEQLGTRDPDRARELLFEIMNTQQHASHAALVAGIEENIKNTTGDEKAMWEVQKLIVSGAADDGDPAKTRELFEKLNSINSGNLPPDLREMYESQKRNLEFFAKSSIAVDIVDNSISTMESTFDDRDEIEEWISDHKSDADIRAGLKNEGLLEWTDTDAEVYMASSHVLMALKLALMYLYPVYAKKKYKIENPIKYFYHMIKTGHKDIMNLEIPADAPPIQFEDARKKTFSAAPGSTFDMRSLFVDLPEECRLFEKYQKGKESLGSHSIYNWQGNAPAFMSEDTSGGKAGILGGSDDIFKSNLFEAGGGIGAFEKVHLAKIKTLYGLKRYDEARDLCIQILERRLKAKHEVTQAEIDAKRNELSKKYKNTILSQTGNNLEAQGMDDAKAQAAGFSNLDDMIHEITMGQLEQRAIIQLQSGVGESIYDVDGQKDFTEFEKKVFEYFAEMDGWGALDVREEDFDWAKDIAQVVAEIVVIEVATAGMGSFVAGAAGIGRVGAFGARGLEAARYGRAGSVVSRSYRAGEAVGATRYGRWMRSTAVAKPVGYLATPSAGGAAWYSRGARLTARNGLHATTLVQGQSMMHGRVVSMNPFSEEGRRGLFTMAVVGTTIYGLDKVGQFMRGQTIGAASAREAMAAGAGQPAATILGRMRQRAGNLLSLGRLSNRIGETTAKIAGKGRLGRYGVNAAEMAVEIAALNNLDDIQNQIGVLAGVIDPAELEAMEEPEWWRRWGHTAAVVVGLRTWRAVAEAAGPREPLLLTRGRPVHEVDAVQAEISTLRAGHELPQGVVKIGGREATQKFLDDALNARAGDKSIRDHYKDAKDITDTGARDARLLELDNILAQHMIIMSGGSVRFGTREAAEAARDSLQKQYPDGVELYVSRNRTPIDSGGVRESYDLSVRYKGKLADHAAKEAGTVAPDAAGTVVDTPAAPKAAPRPEVSLKFKAKPSGSGEYFNPAYSKDTLITRLRTAIKTNRGDTMPSGRLKIGKKEIDIDKLIDSTGMRREYMDAWGMTDKTAQSKRLTELDQRLAEHVFLENSTFTPGLSERQARKAIASSLKENPEARYAFEKSADGKYTVHRLDV